LAAKCAEAPQFQQVERAADVQFDLSFDCSEWHSRRRTLSAEPRLSSNTAAPWSPAVADKAFNVRDVV
jgi:hypothetical protein